MCTTAYSTARVYQRTLAKLRLLAAFESVAREDLLDRLLSDALAARRLHPRDEREPATPSPN